MCRWKVRTSRITIGTKVQLVVKIKAGPVRGTGFFVKRVKPVVLAMESEDLWPVPTRLCELVLLRETLANFVCHLETCDCREQAADRDTRQCNNANRDPRRHSKFILASYASTRGRIVGGDPTIGLAVF